MPGLFWRERELASFEAGLAPLLKMLACYCCSSKLKLSSPERFGIPILRFSALFSEGLLPIPPKVVDEFMAEETFSPAA